MKQRTIRIRMYDSMGIAFPQLASQASTKPKAPAQQRTADKVDINAIHRTFWQKLIGQ